MDESSNHIRYVNCVPGTMSYVMFVLFNLPHWLGSVFFHKGTRGILGGTVLYCVGLHISGCLHLWSSKGAHVFLRSGLLQEENHRWEPFAKNAGHVADV